MRWSAVTWDNKYPVAIAVSPSRTDQMHWKLCPQRSLFVIIYYSIIQKYLKVESNQVVFWGINSWAVFYSYNASSFEHKKEVSHQIIRKLKHIVLSVRNVIIKGYQWYAFKYMAFQKTEATDVKRTVVARAAAEGRKLIGQTSWGQCNFSAAHCQSISAHICQNP